MFKLMFCWGVESSWGNSPFPTADDPHKFISALIVAHEGAPRVLLIGEEVMLSRTEYRTTSIMITTTTPINMINLITTATIITKITIITTTMTTTWQASTVPPAQNLPVAFTSKVMICLLLVWLYYLHIPPVQVVAHTRLHCTNLSSG